MQAHASLKVTMDTYAYFFDKHDKKMVDTLEEIKVDKRWRILNEP